MYLPSHNKCNIYMQKINENNVHVQDFLLDLKIIKYD